MPIVAAFIVGAYLIGAIPFGLLLGLARGVDIRTQGSKNIGATNAGRVLGRKWGYLVLILDILKGLVPTLAASLVLPAHAAGQWLQLAILAVAIAAVLGHVFPIYLGFRGGKGVATTIGVALGIWPHYTIAMAVALLVYGGLRFATGTVSIGSLGLAAAFPIAVLVSIMAAGLAWSSSWPLLVVALLLGVMIIIRHRENIQRLLSGQEMGVRKT